MKTICLFICSVSLLSACFTQQTKKSSPQTKKDIINKVWKGAGGKKVWENSRYLTFVFAPQRDGKTVVSRSHLWDRYTGDYRFETTNQAKQNLLVLFNVNTQKGTSYLDGKALPDSLNIKEIKKAYGNFINDSYWLLAPLKLEDEGVNVSLKDPELVDGTKCDVLHLSFANVGITPGDQYWLYIDSESGQVKRWKYLLQGKQEGNFNWINYNDLGGGLKLSTFKQNNIQNSAITFPQAKVLTNVDRQKFTEK